MCRSLVSETGLACVRVEVECGRVSGTPQRSISGLQGPGTTTMLVRTKEVSRLKVKTSLPFLLVPKNPEVYRREPSRTESAGSRACVLWSHAHGCDPGWVQRTVLRAAAVPSCHIVERQKCAM